MVRRVMAKRKVSKKVVKKKVTRAAPQRTRKKKKVASTVTNGKANISSESGSAAPMTRDKRTKRKSFEVDPAYVIVKKGKTINLGNYESMRFDVSVSMPCYMEDVEEEEARLDTLTMSMLDAEVAAYYGSEEDADDVLEEVEEDDEWDED